jgi:uncharacterized protein YjbI with pentapeptide repeats
MFRSTQMYRARFTKVLYIKAIFGPNSVMDEVYFDDFECVSCDFRRISLVRSNFTRALFRGQESLFLLPNMSDTYLYATRFQDNADLTYANLTNVQFVAAILRNVNMSGVFSDKCNFQSADLSGASLTNGYFIENDFTNATVTDEQLAKAKSLKGSILPNGTVIPINE